MNQQIINKHSKALILCAWACFSSSVAFAAPLTISNTFVAGQPATAESMNQNFSDVKTAVDNLSTTVEGWVAVPGPQGASADTTVTDALDTRITGNADGISVNASNIGFNTADITANADAIAARTGTATAAGDMQYWNGADWVMIPAPTTAKASALTFCGGQPMWATGKCYNIGDSGPAGGIVFYVTDGGAHGLEAAPADQDGGTGATWGCAGTFLIGAAGTAIGTGAQNTADILAGCTDGSAAAATVAGAFSLNGYSDWFLPSKDELNALYAKKAVVGGFASLNYWSSSQSDGATAWSQTFAFGALYVGDKMNSFRVRAVRAF